MKEKFKEYYTPIDEEFKSLWDNCIFVLDTNILLDLYQYTQEINLKFFKIIKENNSRFWIPYQVAYEYHEGRLDKIQYQEDAFDKIVEKVADSKNAITNRLKQYNKHPLIKAEDLAKDISGYFEKLIEDIKKQREEFPNLKKDDYIRDSITDLFDGRVGNKYTDEKIQEIMKLGEKRYKANIPPGFKDAKKDGNKKYGDLILWMQTIDYAKEEKKPIILITQEKKEDWWKFSSKKDKIGPRPELIREMWNEADCDFYMYNIQRFMELSVKYLGQSDMSETVKEIDEIQEQQEKQRKSHEGMLKLAEDQKRYEIPINIRDAAIKFEAQQELSSLVYPNLHSNKLCFPNMRKYSDDELKANMEAIKMMADNISVEDKILYKNILDNWKINPISNIDLPSPIDGDKDTDSENAD